MTARSVTPKDRPALDPMDAMIGALTELSVAVRESSREVRESLGALVESQNVLAGRLDGQSRAAQDLATEIRSFVDSKERMHGRIVMLEELERERRSNGTDAE